jgi:multidrug transporter EmrE-like cation transporter
VAISVSHLWLSQPRIPIDTTYAVWTGIDVAGTKLDEYGSIGLPAALKA